MSWPSKSPSTSTSATVRARSRGNPARSSSADANSTSSSARYLFDKVPESSAPRFGERRTIRQLARRFDVGRAAAAVRHRVDRVDRPVRKWPLDQRRARRRTRRRPSSSTRRYHPVRPLCTTSFGMSRRCHRRPASSTARAAVRSARPPCRCGSVADGDVGFASVPRRKNFRRTSRARTPARPAPDARRDSDRRNRRTRPCRGRHGP